MGETKYGEYLNLDSINSKAFNELKANIQLINADSKKKVIMIASSGSSDGRSTTTAYLSLSLAKSGKKTILVDCDLKKPNIHNMFDLTNDKGLVNYLSGDVSLEKVVKTTKIKNLSILTSGTVTLNYAELFVSARFNEFITLLKEDYDYIIIDTPPITIGADAEVLSRYTDGCVLVVKSGKTERKSAHKAKEILQKVHANIIGVFLNETD
ncbi:CpsD/CapB family tyrosine-protein kinase [Clostridium estertheticum]|uniref:CpsD/CapB family tyrosine-protein kinase n=1 Tax=Clostridium estertheticum TaxID=238834 RepID=A0AA47I566_9CLOT|nr:CpsD/CapB family tyrosine-protein kinase [Clostridium estertheticum]MBU3155550.1 CpsD/CapB family tyrosine-protein kinase [Clostridium estertheticum]MBU3198074.1 CpsD/CapB family tyrosine-protein kinase [Clostridium estertheticum]WAG60052.1 CpsD/CapB family tyrosine-protein kinase [Clostridium estertheticum]WAG65868.1 CpsD/CapB family tyrosine-protein kinase [Clostridium estertheticum]